MAKKPANIIEASREAANLEQNCKCILADGKTILIRRLNWLEFEAVWSELSPLLASLLTAEGGTAPDQLAGELASAPAAVLKLAGYSSGLGEQELSAWHYDDVLTVAAASLRFSFISSKGLQDFFLMLADLGQKSTAAAAGS